MLRLLTKSAKVSFDCISDCESPNNKSVFMELSYGTESMSHNLHPPKGLLGTPV